MSGSGIIGTLGKVLGYLLVIGVVAAVITMVVVAFLQPNIQEPQEILSGAFQSVRSTFSRMRSGNGVMLGRAVGGVDPPSLADLLTSPAAQNIVTPSQEVLMTGGGSAYSCLGGDTEVMIEVQNDIGADQLDISYSLEDANTTTDEPIPARIVKVASCGARSTIKQCIPLAPPNRGIRLHTLAYYYENASVPDETSTKSDLRVITIIREEKRKYPTLLDNDTLKATAKFELNASQFVPQEN